MSVHKAGLQWQVLLQPGFLLLNKAAGMVHVHHTGQLLACKGPGEQVSAGAEWQQQASEAGSYLALGPESKVGAFVWHQSTQCAGYPLQSHIC